MVHVYSLYSSTQLRTVRFSALSVLGCSRRSGRDTNVSFFRIPKVITKQGKDIEILSRKWRIGFLSVIKRENLTDKILSNDRICSRHFISGKPASLLDWMTVTQIGFQVFTLETAKASVKAQQKLHWKDGKESKLDNMIITIRMSRVKMMKTAVA